MQTKLMSLVFGGLMVVLATGCIVSVEPRTAVNPVGTDHTVTVTLQEPDEISEEVACAILTDALEELEELLEQQNEEFPSIYNPCLIDTFAPTVILDDIVEFEIVAGPNAGLNSHEDGDCEPSCAEPDDDNQVSWTYQSNGAPGTDVIRVCADFVLPPVIIEENVSSSALTEEEFFDLLEQVLLDAINEELDTEYDSLLELECQEVQKTWVEPQRPNIGAGLSGLFAGQPTPLPTAPAPAAATAPSQGIRPPSTGDAGLQ